MKRLTALILMLLTLCIILPAQADYYYEENGLSLGQNSLGTITLYKATDKTQTTYTIPTGVEYMKDNAFKGCRNMTHLVIPEGMYVIGSSVFDGCDSLQTVVIPASVGQIKPQGSSSHRPTFIVPHGSYAWQWCVRNDWPFRFPENETAFTQEDCAGYWEAERVEWCGRDRTAEYYSWDHTAALIFAENGTGESRSIVSVADEPTLHMLFTGETTPVTWRLDDDGNVHVYAEWTVTYYQIGENGERENEKEVTESLAFTLYPQGDRLILDRLGSSGKTLRIIFRKGTSSVTREDFLGTWNAIRVEHGDEDITPSDLNHGREVTFAFTDGSVTLQDSRNNPAVVSSSSWSLLPNGVVYNTQENTFHFEGEYLVWSDGGTRIICIRDEGPAAPVSLTAEDYLGYWQLAQVETAGEDVTESIGHIEWHALIFTDEYAFIRSEHVIDPQGGWRTDENGNVSLELIPNADGVTIVSPNLSTGSWTFQPDGSMIVSHFSIPDMTCRIEGDSLIAYAEDQTRRYVRADSSSALNSAGLTARDYLGHWTLTKCFVGDWDATSATSDVGIRSYTIAPDYAIERYMIFSQDADGQMFHETVEESCTWSLLPDGSILFSNNPMPVLLRREGDHLIGTTDEHITTWFSRDDITPTELTPEDYFGYWKAVKVEMDGVDFTEQILSFNEEGSTPASEPGITFTSEHALFHSYAAVTPCAWIFQHDGSMDVLLNGGTLTFRLSGDTLLTESFGMCYTYVRAQESSTLAPQSITTAEDYFGYWKAVKVEMDGVDLTEEVLSYGEQGVTFASGQAMLQLLEIATFSPYTTSAAWIFQPDGSMQLLVGGTTLTYRLQGEQLVTEYAGATFRYAREDAPEAPADPAAPDSDDAAFLRIFTHPATQTDKELVLVSAHASEKVYDPADVTAYLVSLGFPEESIRTHDYTPEDPHSVAVTFASRTVMNPQGRPVTLYAFIVRGTVGTAEWISNFDMGNDSVAKGFDLAARRAMNHFTQYKRDFPPMDPDACLVWLTGHSRGAAVANLVAGCYLSLPAEQVYCVTFATPNVATQTSRTSNILNFVLDSDVVTHVPFTAWGFDRYGLTVHYSEDSLQDIALTDPGDVKILVDFLSSVSQAEYYEMTLEVLHSNAIASRHDTDLSDMLALNVSTLISARMDHADKTAFTSLELGAGVLFNTVFQQRLQLYLGELLPNESRATYDVVKDVITGAGTCHAMSTYRAWIECLYHGLPTVTDAVPGSGGSR